MTEILGALEVIAVVQQVNNIDAAARDRIDKASNKSIKSRPLEITRPRPRETANRIRIMASLSAGEKLVTGRQDGSLRIYDAFSGKRLHVLAGHQAPVTDVLQLDEDTLVSVSADTTLRIWRISDGYMRETIQLQDGDIEDVPTSMASLDDGRFVIGMTCMSLDFNHPAIPCDAFAISACGARFASLDGQITVWDRERSYHRIATLSNGDGTRNIFTSMSFSDPYIIAVSRTSLHVYDATSFELKQQIEVSSEVRDVELAGTDNRLCVSILADSNICVHHVLSGTLLWIWKGKRLADCLTVLAEGRIAIARPTGYSVVVTPPSHIADLIAPVSTQAVDVSVSLPVFLLQSALDSVQSGFSTAAEQCRILINADNCSASLAEWQSAHQLLMLAVNSGAITATASFEGKRNWWFLELYSVAKNFASTFDRDSFHDFQMCLEEAKRAGVIETIEAILGDTVLAQQFQAEIRSLHQAGIVICHRLLSMEGRWQELSDSFTRYKNVERTSKLVGIALQLIPIVGGAAAGVLSAGAEIIDGLSVKDIVDYALGAAEVSDGDVMTFTDRVLGRARKSIAPETINCLGEGKKRELEEIVASSGYSIEVLRILFQDPSLGVTENPATLQLEVCSSTFAHSEVSTDIHQDGAISPELSEEPEEITLARCNTHEESKRNGFTSPTLNKEVISRSSPKELARIWTAFIIRSEDETSEFLAFFRCIRKLLSDEDLLGSVLVLQNEPGKEAVRKMGAMVLEELKKNENLELTIGKEAWARQFVSELSAVCHEEH